MNLSLGSPWRTAEYHYSTTFYLFFILKAFPTGNPFKKSPHLRWALGFVKLDCNHKDVALATSEMNAILDKNLNKKPDRARGNQI